MLKVCPFVQADRKSVSCKLIKDREILTGNILAKGDWGLGIWMCYQFLEIFENFQIEFFHETVVFQEKIVFCKVWSTEIEVEEHDSGVCFID